VITSKPATHDHLKTGQRTLNPGHELLYRADRSFGKNFFESSAEKLYRRSKIPQTLPQ